MKDSNNIMELIRSFHNRGRHQRPDGFVDSEIIHKIGGIDHDVFNSRWEEAGELLWDMSSSLCNAHVMLEQHILTVLEAEFLRYLQRTLSSYTNGDSMARQAESAESAVRVCEISLGMLGNIMAHDELSISLLHEEIVGSSLDIESSRSMTQYSVQSVKQRDLPDILIKLLPVLSDPACLSEYFRIFSTALRRSKVGHCHYA
jgi:hypothetical protein